LQFLTRAGVEVGVASTKAFTTQLVALYLLATTLAKIKGRLNAAHERDVVRSLRHLPAAVQSVLALEPNVIAWSDVFARKENALFLGRGMHFPIAMEGALKLKEISYIHAEAYPAGELNHGPRARDRHRQAEEPGEERDGGVGEVQFFRTCASKRRSFTGKHGPFPGNTVVSRVLASGRRTSPACLPG